MRCGTIVLTLVLAACRPSASVPVADGLLWMEGSWVSEDGSYGEDWTYFSQEDRLEGYAWRIHEGDTLISERMQLLYRRETLFFMAVPDGQDPVYFEVIDTGASYFLARNPFNEYPVQIRYSFDGERLTATISNDNRSESFNFLPQ